MSLQRPERPRNVEPPRIPPGPSRRFIEYLIGLGIGAILLAVALLAMGTLAGRFSSALFTLSIYLYLGLFIATIICLVNNRSRFIGYGMLTMFLISPIIWYISCMATFRYCYHGCAGPTGPTR
jgi:ABC-type polysaccharide/polyol phosphate export permease